VFWSSDRTPTAPLTDANLVECKPPRHLTQPPKEEYTPEKALGKELYEALSKIATSVELPPEARGARRPAPHACLLACLIACRFLRPRTVKTLSASPAALDLV
jgi:hypothetical protein